MGSTMTGVNFKGCKGTFFLQKTTGFFLNLSSIRYVVGFILVDLVGLFLLTIT